MGFLFNHIWSTSGANDRADVNATFVQPFVNYNLGRGLAIGAAMEATANWEADEPWTAPLLFTVSKVALLGKRPVSFVMGAGPKGLFAQRRTATGRGSVSAASSRTTRTRQGNTTTVQGEGATGSRTVTQTGDGYDVNKQVQTQSGPA